MSKRKCLTLDDRVKVVKLLNAGKSSRVIATEFGVGRTQIQNVAIRKREIMEDYESSNPESKRPKRVMPYEQVNTLCYEWFLDATSRQVNVSGPLLKEKGLKFASDLGLVDFKASSGWLDAFLRRNNIVLRVQSGERGSVDMSVVTAWKSKISELCKDYRPSDIFNMDETGLFYRDSVRNTFFKKGESCSGGKRSKERITVALCASMTGEKLPPIVIGKARKPRCFKSLTIDQLPVRYYANRKAWMTSYLMEDWLKWLDRRMRQQQRNILLFLDNAPSHPDIKLKNVKIVFLPPNTTSVSQPMDQGIIQTMKLKYRKRQLQHVLSEMDRHPTKTGPQILKDITVLQAIYWVNKAWNDSSSVTIEKCFAKDGFSPDSVVADVVCENESESASSVLDCDDLPLTLHKLAMDLFDCDLMDLIEIDSKFDTCDKDMSRWDRPATELIKPEESDSDEDEQVLNEPVVKTITLNEASGHIEQLKEFAPQRGHDNFCSVIMLLEDQLVDIRSDSETVKQKTIKDFFC